MERLRAAVAPLSAALRRHTWDAMAEQIADCVQTMLVTTSPAAPVDRFAAGRRNAGSAAAARSTRYYRCRMDFTEYADQDPELHAYTGEGVWLVRCAPADSDSRRRCRRCRAIFDRMYDQRWSPDVGRRGIRRRPTRI